MTQKKYVRFNLDFALQNPGLVAKKSTLEPVEWKFYENTNRIGYIVPDNYNIITTTAYGSFSTLYADHPDDLVILYKPEMFNSFKPKVGEYYWAKLTEQDAGLIVGYDEYSFQVPGSESYYSENEFFVIIPVSIERPTKEDFTTIKEMKNDQLNYSSNIHF